MVVNLKEKFKEISDILNEKNERYERIYKINRDVTQKSKKVIFALHRTSELDEIGRKKQLEESLKELIEIEDKLIKNIATELKNCDCFQFYGSYTAGLQEYTEALTFYFFLSHKEIVSHEFIQERLKFRIKNQTSSLEKIKNSDKSNSKNNLIEAILERNAVESDPKSNLIAILERNAVESDPKSNLIAILEKNPDKSNLEKNADKSKNNLIEAILEKYADESNSKSNLEANLEKNSDEWISEINVFEKPKSNIFTLNPEASDFNPKFSALKSETTDSIKKKSDETVSIIEALDSNLETIDSSAETSDLKSETTNLKSETSDSSAETSTSKSETLIFPYSQRDYMLGLADLTGELMRYCIKSISTGNYNTCYNICEILRNMNAAFISLGYTPRELFKKIEVFKASLGKVENACYSLHLRKSELPPEMLADFINTEECDDKQFSID